MPFRIESCSLPTHFHREQIWLMSRDSGLCWLLIGNGEVTVVVQKQLSASHQCLWVVANGTRWAERKTSYERKPRSSPEFWFSRQSFLKCPTEPQSLQLPPSKRAESPSPISSQQGLWHWRAISCLIWSQSPMTVKVARVRKQGGCHYSF